MHPKGVCDQRTNLYFVQTDDMGRTWRIADGTPIKTPMTDPHCPALVRDFQAEKRLVYMKDINFDAKGNPVILVVTSAYHQPGPAGDPRIWTIAHWDGERWQFHEVTRSTGNYDMGSLYVEGDTWRIIGPTEPGPQHYGTGGEVALWTSRDSGATWTKVRDVTHRSRFNHSYVRAPRRRTARLLRVLGRRQPGRILPVAPLLHQPRRRPRLASAVRHDRGLRQAGSSADVENRRVDRQRRVWLPGVTTWINAGRFGIALP